MKRRGKFISFLVLIIFITVAKYAEGIEISVASSWNLAIDDRYLRWGILQNRYESDIDGVNITISNSDGGRWKLYVRRNDINWHSDFVLKLRRGRNEVTVETTNKEFLEGKGDASYRIQVILEGVSLQISPDTYVTTVIYTITPE
jgi:hypothetical protein